jgi:hypothetical protein
MTIKSSSDRNITFTIVPFNEVTPSSDAFRVSNTVETVEFVFNAPNFDEDSASFNLNTMEFSYDIQVNDSNVNDLLFNSVTWSGTTLTLNGIKSASSAVLPYNKHFTVEVTASLPGTTFSKTFVLYGSFALSNAVYTFVDDANRNVFTGDLNYYANSGNFDSEEKSTSLINDFFDIRNEINVLSGEIDGLGKVTPDPTLSDMLNKVLVDVSAHIFDEYATSRFSGDIRSTSVTGQKLLHLLDYTELEDVFGFNFDVPSKYIITYRVFNDSDVDTGLTITKTLYILPSLSVKWNVLGTHTTSADVSYVIPSGKNPQIRPYIIDSAGVIDVALTKDLIANAQFISNSESPRTLSALNEHLATVANGTYNITIDPDGNIQGSHPIEAEMWDLMFNGSNADGNTNGGLVQSSAENITIKVTAPRGQLSAEITTNISGSDVTATLSLDNPHIDYSFEIITASTATIVPKVKLSNGTELTINSQTITSTRKLRSFTNDELPTTNSFGDQINMDYISDYDIVVNVTDEYLNTYEHTFTISIRTTNSGTLSYTHSATPIVLDSAYGGNNLFGDTNGNEKLIDALKASLTYISPDNLTYQYSDADDAALFNFLKIENVRITSNDYHYDATGGSTQRTITTASNYVSSYNISSEIDNTDRAEITKATGDIILDATLTLDDGSTTGVTLDVSFNLSCAAESSVTGLSSSPSEGNTADTGFNNNGSKSIYWNDVNLDAALNNSSITATLVDKYGLTWSYTGSTGNFVLTKGNHRLDANYSTTTGGPPGTISFEIDIDFVYNGITETFTATSYSDIDAVNTEAVNMGTPIAIDSDVVVTMTLRLTDSTLTGYVNEAFVGVSLTDVPLWSGTFTKTAAETLPVVASENTLFTIDAGETVEGNFNNLYTSRDAPNFKLSDGLDFFQPNSSARFQGKVTVDSKGTAPTNSTTLTGVTTIEIGNDNAISVSVNGAAATTTLPTGFTLDISSDIAAMLFTSNLTYDAARILSIDPSGLNASDAAAGQLKFQRLALMERSSAIETLGEDRLLQLSSTSNFANNTDVLTASTTRQGSFPSSITITDTLPSNWLNTALNNMFIGHWDAVFGDSLNFNVVDVSNNRNALIKAVEFLVDICGDDVSGHINENSDQLAAILSSTGASIGYLGENGDSPYNMSFADVDFDTAFNTDAGTYGDTLVRVDATGTRIWRNCGVPNGAVKYELEEISTYTITNLLNDPTAIFGTNAINLNVSEQAAIRRVRVEGQYDLENGIVNGQSGTTNFITKANLRIPSTSLTAASTSLASESVNAWDLTSGSTRQYKYNFDRVLTVTTSSDVTMGILSVDETKAADITASSSKIVSTSIVNNVIQLDVSLGATGTMADDAALHAAFMSLFDLSGIEVVENAPTDTASEDYLKRVDNTLDVNNSTREERLKAYLGTDGNGSNYVYWELIPHNADIVESNEKLSLEYNITQGSGISTSYPEASGENLYDLAQYIKLNPYVAAKYKVILYMREGAPVRSTGRATPAGVTTLSVKKRRYTISDGSVVYNADQTNNATLDITSAQAIDDENGMNGNFEATANGLSKTSYAIVDILVRSPLELLTFHINEHDANNRDLQNVLDTKNTSLDGVYVSVNRTAGGENLLDYSGNNDTIADSATEKQDLVSVSGLFSDLVNLTVSVSGSYKADYYNYDISNAGRLVDTPVDVSYSASLSSLASHPGVSKNGNEYTLNTDILLFNAAGTKITGLDRRQPGSFAFNFKLTHDISYDGYYNDGVRIVSLTNVQAFHGDALATSTGDVPLEINGYDVSGNIRSITAYKYGLADALPFSNEQGLYSINVNVVDTTSPQLKFPVTGVEYGSDSGVLVSTKHYDINAATTNADHFTSTGSFSLAEGDVAVSHSTTLLEDYAKYDIRIKNVMAIDNNNVLKSKYNMDSVFEDIIDTEDVYDFTFNFKSLKKHTELATLNIAAADHKAVIVEVVGFITEGDKTVMVGPKTLIIEKGSSLKPGPQSEASTALTLDNNAVDYTSFAKLGNIYVRPSGTVATGPRLRMFKF